MSVVLGPCAVAIVVRFAAIFVRKPSISIYLLRIDARTSSTLNRSSPPDNKHVAAFIRHLFSIAVRFQVHSLLMTDGRRPVRYDVELACRELAAADPKLGQLIERAGPYVLKLKSQHSPFEALLESIIYQQLHGKAAAAILKRLLTLFGEFHPTPEHLLGATDDMLRSVGLSRSKALALRDLAAKTLDGTVPTLTSIRRMPDDEIVDRLTQVRGIGPWTVEMLLMFRLG